VAIHLSGPPGDIGRAGRPTLDLAPGGVYRAVRVTPGAGALLPHRFTLACDGFAVHRRSAFCCTFLRVASTGCWPAPCPAESRPSSTGSNPAATTRPTHRPHHCARPVLVPMARSRPGGSIGLPRRGPSIDRAGSWRECLTPASALLPASLPGRGRRKRISERLRALR
jgi:hypothetical protein